jgi:hypothetical protein
LARLRRVVNSQFPKFFDTNVTVKDFRGRSFLLAAGLTWPAEVGFVNKILNLKNKTNVKGG